MIFDWALRRSQEDDVEECSSSELKNSQETPIKERKEQKRCTSQSSLSVSNWALNKRKAASVDAGVKLSTKDVSAAITALKKEEGTAWLRCVSSVPLQQALRHWDAASTNNAFTLTGDKLTLAKHKEALPLVWSRPLPPGAKPGSVTVSQDKIGRYFVSLLVEEDIGPLAPTENVVGMDLGLKSFLVTSDGETRDNPKYSARDEKKLAKAQRKHASKKKGGKNRAKARRTLAKLHTRIADTRRNFQHQASTQLIRENQVICLETLNVKGMLKNHCLAKASSDVGWGGFVRQLEYKARWYGRTMVRVARWYPS
jgi:putative transposase